MNKLKITIMHGVAGLIVSPCKALAAPYFSPAENYTQAQANYLLNTARSFCKSQKLGFSQEETSRDNVEFIYRLPYQSQLRGWIKTDNANKAVMAIYKNLDSNCDISKGKFQKTLWRMPSWFD